MAANILKDLEGKTEVDFVEDLEGCQVRREREGLEFFLLYSLSYCCWLLTLDLCG